jgi:hypothetical protein
MIIVCNTLILLTISGLAPAQLLPQALAPAQAPNHLPAQAPTLNPLPRQAPALNHKPAQGQTQVQIPQQAAASCLCCALYHTPKAAWKQTLLFS